jgi:hypothetical protein
MTTALEWGEGTASRPGRSIPPEKTRYPLYRRLDGPQGQSWQVRKISPPSGLDPRNFQPVVNCYTHYATMPKNQRMRRLKFWQQHSWQFKFPVICCCTARKVTADLLKECRTYVGSSSPNDTASHPKIYESPSKELFTDAVWILKVAGGHMEKADCQ